MLSLAALSVMSGVTVDWQTLPRILEPAMVWKWGPGAAYGLVLFLIMKRRNSFAVMMGSVVVATGLYHLGLVFLDISVEEAKAQGLLLSGMPQGGLWPAFGPSDLAYVDWSVVAAQVPNLLTVTVVTLLCLLVYLNGLELATGVKIDLDREFRVAGLAGMCAGAGGSAPGCQAFVFTLPCWRYGADTPWTGVVAAFVLGLTLFFGGGILELLPKSVIGGLLLSIGVDLLDYWLRSLRKRLHWTDYGIVLLICVTIAVFGFIEGVGAGMIAMLALFAFRLSRVDVVREEFTGCERHSNKIRSVPDRAILLERGERIRAYRLRGYVFFGSALSSGQSPQATSGRDSAPGVHPAGLHRDFRLRFFRHQCLVRVHPVGGFDRDAGGDQRGFQADRGKPAEHHSWRRPGQSAVREGPGPWSGTL